MLTIAIVDFLFDSIYDIGPKYIKDGDFDKLLLRPIHPLISVIGDTKTFTAFGYMAISLILIISMLIKLHINITFILITKILRNGKWSVNVLITNSSNYIFNNSSESLELGIE